MLAVPAAASGATISPNTLADDNTDNGNCTLREAVIAANTDAADDACPAGSGADEIVLAGGTYELGLAGNNDDVAATGDLDVTADLRVVGNPAGSTIDANGLDRSFEVFANATATLDGLSVTGGGNNAAGGAIQVRAGATANIANSVLAQNTTQGFGGAVEVFGTATLTDTTVAGNSAQMDGGGIEIFSGTLSVQDTTVSGNSAVDDGGAIQASAEVNLTNTTLSGNTAGDDGGGIRGMNATINLRYSTITANTAEEGGGSEQSAGTTATTKGSIVAGNTATAAGPDCAGNRPLDSQGFNLIGSTAGCTFNSVATDKVNTDPLLRPLAENGGPTFTHAIAANSPARDGGDPADFPASDQRGAPRNPDIGAYEFVTCRGVVVNRVGTAGDDVLTGAPGAADGLLGLGGSDTLSAGQGADAVCGGSGDDTLKGGGGDDSLSGQGGTDRAKGGGGADAVLGGGGPKDRLNGGNGSDELSGGAGLRDRCDGDAGRDVAKRSCEIVIGVP